jgi:hypothetical protein
MESCGIWSLRQLNFCQIGRLVELMQQALIFRLRLLMQPEVLKLNRSTLHLLNPFKPPKRICIRSFSAKMPNFTDRMGLALVVLLS